MAIGCVLSRVNADGMETVIVYGSRILSKTEKRWPTYDRELWAIIWAIRHFRQVTPFESSQTTSPFCPCKRWLWIVILQVAEPGRLWKLIPMTARLNTEKAKNMPMLTMSRRPLPAEDATPMVEATQMRPVSTHTQTDPESFTCTPSIEIAPSTESGPTASLLWTSYHMCSLPHQSHF